MSTFAKEYLSGLTNAGLGSKYSIKIFERKKRKHGTKDIKIDISKTG